MLRRQAVLRFGAVAMADTELRPLTRYKGMLQDGRSLESIAQNFQDSFFPHHASVAKSGGPALASFAQSSKDIQELSSLLMKVFCDTQQLDRLRFVFALTARELEHPTTELFNIYLIALSQSDAVTESEVSNVEEMMAVASAKPDVVSNLCMTELRIKMGQPNLAPLKAVESQVKECFQSGNFPVGFHAKITDLTLLLFTFSSFTPLFWTFFTLIQEGPAKLSMRVLLDVLLQFARDDSVPSTCLTTLVKYVGELESTTTATIDNDKAKVPMLDMAGGSSSGSGGGGEDSSRFPPIASKELIKAASSNSLVPPPSSSHSLVHQLIHEKTALRMVVKAVREKDVKSCKAMVKFTEDHDLITEENKVYLHLLTLHVVASCGQVAEALDVIEEKLNADDCSIMHQSTRFKLVPLSDVGMLRDVPNHPVAAMLNCLTREAGAAIADATAALAARKEAGKPVTLKSLELLLAACAELQDEGQAIGTLEAFTTFGVKPSPTSFALLLKACTTSGTSDLSKKYASILRAMERSGVVPDRTVVRSMFRQSLDNNNNLACALEVVELADRHNLKLEGALIHTLVTRLAGLLDFDGVVKTARLARRQSITLVRPLRERIVKAFEGITTPAQQRELTKVLLKECD